MPKFMNLKKLMERKESIKQEMRSLIDKADTEERVLNEEEVKKFGELKSELERIDESAKAIQDVRSLEEHEDPKEPGDDPGKKDDDVEKREYQEFDAYIRGKLENRDGTNMKVSDNSAIIPATIAQKIIEKVVDICPIYQSADRYNVKGTLSIPYYDEESGDITMEYADEFTEGDSTGGKFKSIDLKGYLGRAITDVSKSLINNSSFNVVDFVIKRMARSIARFIERELLKGTDGKIDGLSKTSQTVTAASATKITADELIDLQDEVPDSYQNDAYFIMSRKTRTSIRKLKDGQGNYLLNRDATAKWGYTLLGKDVYTSSNMDEMEAGKTAVFYGNYGEALAVNVSEEINIEVLRETKARQHVVEVLGFVEMDSKIQNNEAVAKLAMAAQ